MKKDAFLYERTWHIWVDIFNQIKAIVSLGTVMSWNDWSLLRAIISNNSFPAVNIKFSCTIFIYCRAKPLGSAPHICLYFNSKNTDFKDWGMLNGINIFPFSGLALLEEWISLTNESISWSVTAINSLKLFKNSRISLQTHGVDPLKRR